MKVNILVKFESIIIIFEEFGLIFGNVFSGILNLYDENSIYRERICNVSQIFEKLQENFQENVQKIKI